MNSPVIALGLDAGDPQLIEQWIKEDKLPNIKKLYQNGSYERLSTYDWYRAETPWTTFLTGQSPEQTGYWSPIKYVSKDYDVKVVHAFDFKEFPPFYAELKDKKVVIFDMPQGALVEGIDGKQVLAWGTHSGQTPSISYPPEAWQEIAQKYGEHPLLDNDDANCYNYESMYHLFEKLVDGVKKRADACIGLIKEDNPDFFLTIFGEAHVAGHYFWHLSQEHPLKAAFDMEGAKDLLLESFIAIDSAIGRIVDSAPENATIVVFSAHGMGANVMDLPSVVFLPEVMYRLNFPGKMAIGANNTSGTVAPLVNKAEVERDKFARAVWRRTKEQSSLKNIVKECLGMKWYERLDYRYKGQSSNQPIVLNPFHLHHRGDHEPFQSSTWFKEFWPQMKAYALPSFSEGYIRINGKGREPNGVVDPADYDKVCDEITAEINKLKDARTGKPMVEKIIKTRKSLDDETPKSPDADLVVVWQEDSVADVIESETIGRVGPLPYLRTGSHRAGGFFLINQKVGLKKDGHAVDLAPTFLNLCGKPATGAMLGTPLITN